MARGLIIAIVVLLVLVAGVIVFMQFGSNGTDTGTGAGQESGQTSPTQEEQTSEETPPVTQPSVKEFSIEADDRGFYIDGADIGSISAGSGEAVKITFEVKSTGVYYGGLDFRGCGKTTGKTNPGSSTNFEFTATSTCIITSYWPSSGVVKDNLQVNVI